MKFKEFYLLAQKENIKFDMCVSGLEMPATIIPVNLTDYGKRIFKCLFEADIELKVPPPVVGSNTKVIINQANLWKLGEFFCLSVSGCVANSICDRLFNTELYPQVELVAQMLFKTLLYLGGYRYCVQADGYSKDVIYAWNIEEAMKTAGFPLESRIGGK